LNDLFANVSAHPAERLSVLALSRLDVISARTRTLLERNRRLLDQFLDSRDDLDTIRPEFGTVVAPRVKRCGVEELCLLLREKFETSVVPGKFFEMPDHIRIGIACDSQMLNGGLERLGAALDDIARN
jgi:aspartate/methionine/tyrosine aminotransferase